MVLIAGGGLVFATSATGRHLFAIGSPGRGVDVDTPAAPAVTTTTAPPPTVVSITPAANASDVSWDARITVVLSHPPVPGAPLPVLDPPVAGQWMINGATLTFVPTGMFAPWSTEQVTIPSGLASPDHSSFGVEGVSTLRVQQLLAELEYLPFDFNPSGGTSALGGEPTTADLVSPAPEAGNFAWRYSNVPGSLSSQWAPGEDNVLTQGAVMQFESDHGITDDGVAGPAVWNLLTQAVASRQIDLSPYDYLLVSESIPEQLAVWRDGDYIYSTPANTGVAGAVTALGTYPVYSRFQSTTMTGTDPDGYHYTVAAVPWVAYFNGGDAVHGYQRASYGWPQSNGCVELPISNAEVVWSMDPIGTLVTVTS